VIVLLDVCSVIEELRCGLGGPDRSVGRGDRLAGLLHDVQHDLAQRGSRGERTAAMDLESAPPECSPASVKIQQTGMLARK